MKSRDGKFSVFKNKFGTYTVRFYDETGRRRSVNFQKATERDGFIRMVKRQEPLDRWVRGEGSIRTALLTVEDLFPKWIEHGETVRKASASCLGNYKAHFKYHILPVIGKQIIPDLSLIDIEKVAMSIDKKKPLSRSYRAVRESLDEFFDGDSCLSKSYQREVLLTLIMFGKWAFERGYMSTQPFKAFRMPPVPEQPYDYWRLEDEDRFFDWLESGGWYEKETPRYRKHGKDKLLIKLQLRKREEIKEIVLFALRSGMRLGEIGYLRMEDVNFDEGWVIVRGSYSRKEGVMKNTTKGKRARYIEMNDDMRDILSRYRNLPKRQPVFNINRSRIKNFSGLCRLAGVRVIHFHGLRHTCLTNLANGYGMDAPLSILKVQKIAGHSDLKTTQRYVHSEGIKDTSSLQWSREKRRERLTEKCSMETDELRQAKLTVIKGGHWE